MLVRSSIILSNEHWFQFVESLVKQGEIYFGSPRKFPCIVVPHHYDDIAGNSGYRMYFVYLEEAEALVKVSSQKELECTI